MDFYTRQKSKEVHKPMTKQAVEPLFTNVDVTPFLSITWQHCIRSWLQSVYERSGSDGSRRHFKSLMGTFFLVIPKSPENVTRADVETFMRHKSMGPCHPGADP